MGDLSAHINSKNYDFIENDSSDNLDDLSVITIP